MNSGHPKDHWSAPISSRAGWLPGHLHGDRGRRAQYFWLSFCGAILWTVGCGPPAEQTQIDRAEVLIAAGKWNEALSYLDEAVRVNAKSAQAFARRGEVHFRLRHFSEAAQDLQKSKSLSPAKFDRSMLLAQSLLEAGDAGATLAECEEILKHDPQSNQALILRGRANLAKKEFDLALQDFLQARSLDPDVQELRLYVGVVQLQKRKYTEADRELTEFIKRNRMDAHAYWIRAKVRIELQRLGDAEADRARAQELDPTLAFAESVVGKRFVEGLLSGNQGSGTMDTVDSKVR